MTVRKTIRRISFDILLLILGIVTLWIALRGISPHYPYKIWVEVYTSFVSAYIISIIISAVISCIPRQ
jgi:hypothetical protein